HLVGQTTGVTAREARFERKPDYLFEARRRYLTKNLHPLHAAACDLAYAIGCCLNRIRCPITGRKDNVVPHELRDHIRHSVFVRGFRPPIVSNCAVTAASAPERTSYPPVKEAS